MNKFTKLFIILCGVGIAIFFYPSGTKDSKPPDTASPKAKISSQTFFSAPREETDARLSLTPLQAKQQRQARFQQAKNFWVYTSPENIHTSPGESIYLERAAGLCMMHSGRGEEFARNHLGNDTQIGATYSSFINLCAGKSEKEWRNRYKEIEKRYLADPINQARLKLANDPMYKISEANISENELRTIFKEILASKDPKFLISPHGSPVLYGRRGNFYFDGRYMDSAEVTAFNVALLQLSCEWGEACDSPEDLNLIDSCLWSRCYKTRAEWIDKIIVGDKKRAAVRPEKIAAYLQRLKAVVESQDVDAFIPQQPS